VRLTAAKADLGRHRKLHLARPQGSDSGSAPEDGELRSARSRARTRAQPRKTANSAPPDPGLGLGLSPGRRRTPPRPTLGLGHGLTPEDDKLRLARPGGSTSTSEEPPPRPAWGTDRPRQQEAPSLPYPELTRAMGNQTDVPSGSLHHASNDGAPHAL
jgi:hypothetical protein